MSDLPAIGTLVGAADVVAGAQAVLAEWLPAYAVALNEAMPALGMLPPMKIDRVPLAGVASEADQVPAVFVSSPGTVGQWVKTGTDTWGAWFLLHVVLVDRDEDWSVTADRIQRWASLVTAVMLAHSDLSGTVDDLVPVEQAFGQLPTESRTLAGTTVTFRAFVPIVAQQGAAGPNQPPPGLGKPPAISPVVSEIDLTISQGIAT